MLLSIDFKLDIDFSSVNALNSLNIEGRKNLQYIQETIESNKDLIGTFNVDTESFHSVLTHINGLPIVYNDFVETYDEYLKESTSE